VAESIAAYEQANAGFWQGVPDERKVVSLRPWTDGPDQVEVSASRIQELMDSGDPAGVAVRSYQGTFSATQCQEQNTRPCLIS